MKKFSPIESKNSLMGTRGQVGLPQVLALLIILFVVFTVGRILLNNTSLDPDASDGGTGGVGGGSGTLNSLTNIGLVVMSGIVLISAMASIVIRFF